MSTKIIPENVPSVKENSLVCVSFINSNVPVVSSLDVARHFHKKHKHVLEEIRKIIGSTPKDFHWPNFRPMIREEEIGKGATRNFPFYLLTRDGFSLLVMGFTGKEALAWKILYIQAFNEMETVLREKFVSAEHHEKICTALYSLGPDKKRKMRSVVRYHQMGLGKGGIAKLVGIHGREVSRLLNCAIALGFFEKPSGSI